MNRDKKILIAGAGLVGSLLGLRLLQKDYDVDLYESRGDLRKENISAGRSINLALSHRGIRALVEAGVDKKILDSAIRMNGRMIHGLQGELTWQLYSSRETDFINSISRRVLNGILMDEIEKIKPGAIKFKTKLLRTDNNGNQFIFEAEHKEILVENAILLATDGASSKARSILFDNSNELHFDYSQKFQNYGYKELNIPPNAANDFAIEKNALHIWPRGHFMMIALPNPDSSFTATLFLPYHGNESFDKLSTSADVNNFFNKYFSDALTMMPDLQNDFFHNPTGHLYTIKCFPWNYHDKLLLMGDAAHAIIPFYGQGMNCGFEDVLLFNKLMDEHQDILSLFNEFSNQRKQNADAIADLAEDNFIEMRDKVAYPVFQRKRKLEMKLERIFPDYYSKYSLVTFRPDVSYYHAMIVGRKQDELLLSICEKNQDDWNENELKEIYSMLQNISIN